MGGFSTMWAVAGMALLAGQTLAQCGDGELCSTVKTVTCESNQLDSSFMLDKSGSMEWGITCQRGVQNCQGADCPVSISQYRGTGFRSCKRRDIMRVVLRLVLKKLFTTFDQVCNEYLQSAAYILGGISGGCQSAGLTRSRLTFVWWSELDSRNEILKAETFTKPNGWTLAKSGDFQIGTLQQRFIRFFYDNNGQPRDAYWGKKTNGDPFMKEDGINTFFDTILFKGNSLRAGGYPLGEGQTYPQYGMRALNQILRGYWLNDYSESQKEGATFPVFLMTDGEYTGGAASLRNMQDFTAQLRNDVTDGKPNRIRTYGLGLTGDLTLQGKQEALYKGLGYTDRIALPGDIRKTPFYFSDQDTADKVVEGIFKEITGSCQACYTKNGEEKCVGLDDPIPQFEGDTTGSGTNGGDDTRITDDTVVNVYPKSKKTRYIRIGTKVIEIPKGTTTCSSYAKGNPLATFVDYGINGECKCCASRRRCVCAYNLDDAKQSKRELYKGTEEVVYEFSPESNLAKQVATNSDFVAIEDSDEEDGITPPVVVDPFDPKGDGSGISGGSNGDNGDTGDNGDNGDGTGSNDGTNSDPNSVNVSSATSITASMMTVYGASLVVAWTQQ